MGQYHFHKTGEVTNLAGEIVGSVQPGGKLHLQDESLKSDVLGDLQSQVQHDTSHEWTDDLLFAANMPSKERAGEIRLACINCDTDEADWVNEFPKDWEILDEVQSCEDSLRPGGEPDSSRSAFDWYTHLGVCPCCQKTKEQ